MPLNPGHPFSSALAFISSGSSALAVAVEVIRAYQEINALCECFDCVQQVTGVDIAQKDQATCESAYFISNTDIPYQPAAPITSPLWHIWTSILMVIIWLTEFPGIQWPCAKIGTWVFGPESAVWPTGALQILVGLALLGVPAALMGTYQEIWLRYITGWLLVGVGSVILFIGMIKGGEIRQWRGQHAPAASEPDAKPGNVKKAWGELRGHITSMMGTNVVMGSFMTLVSNMDSAVGGL